MGINNSIEYKKLLYIILEGIFRKKGQEIIELDLEKIDDTFCRSFIICHADSSTQVRAIAESVQEIVKQELKTSAWHVEGMENLHWVLLDYTDIIVHVFQKPYREYYNLEDLWADAEVKTYEDTGNIINLLNENERT
ncbi:ribosome silencing factor [Bacteroidota bacterium]